MPAFRAGAAFRYGGHRAVPARAPRRNGQAALAGLGPHTVLWLGFQKVAEWAVPVVSPGILVQNRAE